MIRIFSRYVSPKSLLLIVLEPGLQDDEQQALGRNVSAEDTDHLQRSESITMKLDICPQRPHPESRRTAHANFAGDRQPGRGYSLDCPECRPPKRCQDATRAHHVESLF